jgi:hypothetical protein
VVQVLESLLVGLQLLRGWRLRRQSRETQLLFVLAI